MFWSIIYTMKEIPLNALRAFACVYETGGIRPAARALEVSHSSVIRHLRELEAWLGTPLLDADGPARSTSFTPQGEKLGRDALASLKTLGRTLDGIREQRSPNHVTLSTPPSVAARWLLPHLHEFGSRHPTIDLSVLAEKRVMDPAGHGADLALRMGDGPWPGVDASPLMDDHLYPVMSPACWKQLGRPTSIKALRQATLLHDRDPAASWARWAEAFPGGGIDPAPGPRFDSTDLVLRAATQGLGVALARHRLAQDDLASGLLINPFEECALRINPAYWLVRARGRRRGAVDLVIDWLMERAASGQPVTG